MQLINEDYLSVAEAAELLKVAKSTIWRWINQGDLPAYRFGHRHVLINQKDLSRLIAPARAEKGKEILEHERQRLSCPMTGDEQEKALAAIDAAERFSRRLREQQTGQLFPDSVEVIRQVREKRTKSLP